MLNTKSHSGRDPEIYWKTHHEVGEAETVVNDLLERLDFWREELERRKRKLARIEGA